MAVLKMLNPSVDEINFDSFNSPFDVYRTAVFPVVMFLAYWVGSFVLGVDALIFSLAAIISMEFSELAENFKKLKSVDKIARNESIDRLIDRHNKLSDLSDKLQNIFGMIFFCTLTINSLIMCFIAFQLSAPRSLEVYSFFIPYMCLIAGQSYLLCFFGQKVIDSGNFISDGAYDCGWEESDDGEFRKKVALTILRSNKPNQLTAIKFAVVSLTNYSSVSLFFLDIFKH